MGVGSSAQRAVNSQAVPMFSGVTAARLHLAQAQYFSAVSFWAGQDLAYASRCE